MMMVKCPQCGAENTPHNQICIQCGRRMPAAGGHELGTNGTNGTKRIYRFGKRSAAATVGRMISSAARSAR